MAENPFHKSNKPRNPWAVRVPRELRPRYEIVKNPEPSLISDPSLILTPARLALKAEIEKHYEELEDQAYI